MVLLQRLMRIAVDRCKSSPGNVFNKHAACTIFRSMIDQNMVTENDLVSELVNQLADQKQLEMSQDIHFPGDLFLFLMTHRQQLKKISCSSIEFFALPLMRKERTESFRPKRFFMTTYILQQALLAQHDHLESSVGTIEEMAKLNSQFLSTLSPSAFRSHDVTLLVGVVSKFCRMSLYDILTKHYFADLARQCWEYYSHWQGTYFQNIAVVSQLHHAHFLAMICINSVDPVTRLEATKRLVELITEPQHLAKIPIEETVNLSILHRAVVHLLSVRPISPGPARDYLANRIAPWMMFVAQNTSIALENWKYSIFILRDLFSPEQLYKDDAEKFCLAMWKSAIIADQPVVASFYFDRAIADAVTSDESTKVIKYFAEQKIEDVFFFKRLMTLPRVVSLLASKLHREPDSKPMVMDAVKSIVFQLVDYFFAEAKEGGGRDSGLFSRKSKVLKAIALELPEVPNEALDKVLLLVSSTTDSLSTILEDALVLFTRFAQSPEHVAGGCAILKLLCNRGTWSNNFSLIVALRFAVQHKQITASSEICEWMERTKPLVNNSFGEVSKLLRELRDFWNTERVYRKLSALITRSALQSAIEKPLTTSSFLLVATVAEAGIPRESVDQEIQKFVSMLPAVCSSAQLHQYLTILTGAMRGIFSQQQNERRHAAIVRSLPLLRYVTHHIMQHRFRELSSKQVSDVLEMVTLTIAESDFPGCIAFCDNCVSVLATMPPPVVPLQQPHTTEGASGVPSVENALEHFAQLHINVLRLVRHFSAHSRVLITSAIAKLDLSKSDDHLLLLMVGVVSGGDTICAA